MELRSMELKDWKLSKLGEDIWHKKYQQNGESFSNWLYRVSGGDADVAQLIVDKKFLFGGRILASRGVTDRKVTYSNCFLADTPVLTKEGYKPIQDINIDDYVFTHNNRFMRVDNTLQREYNGELIRIQHKIGINNSDVICTPNHKFLTKDRGWVAAEDLSLNDYIQSPIYRYTVEDFTVDLAEIYEPQDNEEIIIDDDKVYTSTTYIGGNGAICKRYTKPINRFITIDKKFRRLLGLFIADGSISKNTYEVYDIWQIVFNKKDEKYFKQWKQYCTEVFGRDMQVRENEKQHTLILRTDNKFLGSLFIKLCGKPNNKHIHESIADFYTLLGILDGDGTFSNDGILKIQLANPTLINSIEEILIKCNINLYTRKVVTTRLKETDKDYTGHCISFTKLISQDIFAPELNKNYEDDRLNKQYNYIIYKSNNYYKKIYGLKRISNIKTVVYNLSVNTDNSYVVNNLVAHNCYVLPQVEDSIEGIYDTAKHLARTFSYGGGVGIDISNLRPKGSPVNNAAKTTSGAVSFMDTFSQVSSVIGQAGRRGALMISMDCEHPDIEDFIDAKKNTDKLEGCNISVRTDGDFIKNSPLMHKLAENNWDYAEPKQYWVLY